jgi:hypothetical protein
MGITLQRVVPITGSRVIQQFAQDSFSCLSQQLKIGILISFDFSHSLGNKQSFDR